MKKLYIMCGLPASGKSTHAEEIAEKERQENKESIVIISTDKIREELYGNEQIQGKGEDVFDIAFKRIFYNLKENKDVIFDATNINFKRRIDLVKRYRKYCDKIICSFMLTPYEICLERNKNRERKVPEEVIEKMYHNFYIPHFYEGFDEIEYCMLPKYEYFYREQEDMEQDNPHHTLSILNHCKKAHNEVCKLTDDYNIKVATLLHDIGKFKTKKFEDAKGNPSEIAHFYGHENVGAYDAFFYYTPIVISFEQIPEISKLIQWHMLPYITMGDKKKKYYQDLLGEKFLKDIMIINEADRAAK